MQAEAPPKALDAFDLYTARLEARLAQEHRSAPTFLAAGYKDDRLQRGEVVIEKLTLDKGEVPGGLLHDWRGTAFVQGATAADFERLMKNISGMKMWPTTMMVPQGAASSARMRPKCAPQSGQASTCFR